MTPSGRVHGQVVVIEFCVAALVLTSSVGLPQGDTHLARECACDGQRDETRHILGTATLSVPRLGTCILRAPECDLGMCGLCSIGMHRRYLRPQREVVCLLLVRRCWSQHWDMHSIASPRRQFP